MQLLLLLMLISSGCSHKVVDSVEDLSPEHFNSSTLLQPVARPVVSRVTSSNHSDEKASSASSWKIATSLADNDNKADNLTTSKEQPAGHTSSAEEPTTSKPENASSSEFRPSPQLGSFLGEDNFVVPTPTPTRQPYDPFTPVIKRPPPGFFSPYKEARWPSLNKIPKENMFKQYWDPFRMETPLLTLTPAKHYEEWKPSSVQDSKPTAEAPVASLPAGSLYQTAGTFKHSPDEFGMDFHGDLRELALKKPAPWRGVMRLLAALVPVGIIVSALTPSVLHVETTGNNNVKPNANDIFRRADHLANPAGQPASTQAGGRNGNHLGPSFPASSSLPGLGPNTPNLPVLVPAMSERCRRRLLCELQADHNYQRSAAAPAARDCRSMRCEDLGALHTALHWMLHTHHTHN